jgi:hypothetical protein
MTPSIVKNERVGFPRRASNALPNVPLPRRPGRLRGFQTSCGERGFSTADFFDGAGVSTVVSDETDDPISVAIHLFLLLYKETEYKKIDTSLVSVE